MIRDNINVFNFLGRALKLSHSSFTSSLSTQLISRTKMALFGNPFPFRSSWWADPIPDIDIDFWPLADYDVFNPFGLSRSALRPQRALRQREQEKAVTQEVVSDKDKFQV